jgi:hypothetical protein
MPDYSVHGIIMGRRTSAYNWQVAMPGATPQSTALLKVIFLLLADLRLEVLTANLTIETALPEGIAKFRFLPWSQGNRNSDNFLA